MSKKNVKAAVAKVTAKVTEVKKPELYDYDNAIIKLTALECIDQTPHAHGAMRQVCTEMFQEIIDCYGDGKTLKPETIDAYFQYVINKSRYNYNHGYYYNDYYSKCRCIHKNQDIVAQTIMVLFRHYIPTVDILEKLVVSQSYDKCYNVLNENPNFTGLDIEQLKIIIEKRLKYSLDEYDETELINFVFKHIQFTAEEVLLLCECRNTLLSGKLAGIITKFAGNFTSEYMSNACIALPYSKPIVQALIMRSVKITGEHLKIVCSKCSINAIDYILQTTRLPVTKDHFKALIIAQTYNKINNDYSTYYRRGSMPQSNWTNGYSQEKMELLIKYGYKPDYDDVMFAIEQRVELPGIDRFNINLDMKLLEACWDKDFYPTYPWKCIDPEMIELQKACTTRREKRLNY